MPETKRHPACVAELSVVTGLHSAIVLIMICLWPTGWSRNDNAHREPWRFSPHRQGPQPIGDFDAGPARAARSYELATQLRGGSHPLRNYLNPDFRLRRAKAVFVKLQT